MNPSDFLYRLNTCIGVSVVSALVTHPIDVIKVRSQSNNKTVIRKLSDLVMLTNGMNASILRNTSFVGSKMFAYETIKKHYDLNTFHEKIIAGCLSGAFGCVVGTPFDKIMVQLQHSPQKTTILSKVRDEYRKGGLFEFWKGTKYTFLRTIAVTVCQFAVYDEIKEFIMKKTTINNEFVTFFISSVCASSSAAVLSNPLDLCKTRIMNNTPNQTISEIIQKEGFRSLSKGMLANVSRQIPLHFVRFSLLEYVTNFR